MLSLTYVRDLIALNNNFDVKLEKIDAVGRNY